MYVCAHTQKKKGKKMKLVYHLKDIWRDTDILKI